MDRINLKKQAVIKNRFKRAQSILEYAIIIAAVSAALIAMRPYLQRGVQSVLKNMSLHSTPKALP